MGWGAENKRGGDREGLTIRAQRAHFTHTSSKPMEFALVAVEQGKREGGGEKKTLISFGSLRLHLTTSIKKGREAWSVHCHKINTDTKSKEREIKRVIDVEREKVKKTGKEKVRMKRKEHTQRGKERQEQRRDEGKSSTSHSRDYLLVGLTGSQRMISGLLVGFRCKRHPLLIYCTDI